MARLFESLGYSISCYAWLDIVRERDMDDMAQAGPVLRTQETVS